MSRLDVDELKHLALQAMQRDRDEDAIRLLRDAMEQAPDNAELLYLLGMVHSHIGLVDRAIEEIGAALAREPQLTNARFQLGLLHFVKREFKQSEAVWRPLLATLEEDDPLHIFAVGLTQVGHDELEAAIATLERGIGLCRNAALNEDIRRIVAEAQRFLAGTAPDGRGPGNRLPDKPAQASQHVLLSGYSRQQESK